MQPHRHSKIKIQCFVTWGRHSLLSSTICWPWLLHSQTLQSVSRNSLSFRQTSSLRTSFSHYSVLVVLWVWSLDSFMLVTSRSERVGWGGGERGGLTFRLGWDWKLFTNKLPLIGNIWKYNFKTFLQLIYKIMNGAGEAEVAAASVRMYRIVLSAASLILWMSLEELRQSRGNLSTTTRNYLNIQKDKFLEKFSNHSNQKIYLLKSSKYFWFDSGWIFLDTIVIWALEAGVEAMVSVWPPSPVSPGWEERVQ